VEYCVFSRYCRRIVKQFLNIGSVAIDTSVGRAPVATPDVVENVNQIVQRSSHISVRHLS
jgi:hypothetical protein